MASNEDLITESNSPVALEIWLGGGKSGEYMRVREGPDMSVEDSLYTCANTRSQHKQLKNCSYRGNHSCGRNIGGRLCCCCIKVQLRPVRVCLLPEVIQQDNRNGTSKLCVVE